MPAPKKHVADFIASKKEQKNSLKGINQVINDLETLLQISPTSERFSLLGSTCKRKALISTTKPLKLKSLAESAWYYQKANSICSTAYSITNWFELETILVLAGYHKWGQMVKYGKESYQLPTFEKVNDILNELTGTLKKCCRK